MNVYLDPSLTIQKAASRIRGDRLAKLVTICEQQKSISTRRLAKLVDELRDSDRMDGLHFKALADLLRKTQ